MNVRKQSSPAFTAVSDLVRPPPGCLEVALPLQASHRLSAGSLDMLSDANEDEVGDATTEGSMVDVKPPKPDTDNELLAEQEEDEPDVYDVNVLAWDTAVSPLHLAIIKGHVDVVKCLVSDFGADVLLPVKLFNEYDKSAKIAVLTLVLALQLPLEKAEEMTRTLIQMGASTAQADVDQITALHYAAAHRPEMCETLFDADKTGARRAINHLSASGYQYNLTISGPLLAAIQARDGLTALRLLTQGSRPQITFDAYAKAYRSRHDLPPDSAQNKRNFEQTLAQPVISAVHCELPQLAKALVEQHDVDPNTLSPTGWLVVHGEWTRRYSTGESLLDLVKGKLATLRAWKPSEQKNNPPKPLKDGAEYLSNRTTGTYQYWSACEQLRQAKDDYARDWKAHVEAVQRFRKQAVGTEQKQAAIYDMIEDFRKLEVRLESHGAKTFYQLYPGIEKPEKTDNHYYSTWEPTPRKPFETEFRFKLGDLNDEAQAMYVKLFEAAWQGDLKTLKGLTLTPWHDSSSEEHPPLQVAVQDQHNLSPFSIAVIHGRFAQAGEILEIARAQYQPPEAAKREHYTMVDSEGSEGSEDDHGDVRLRSEIVDDQFTVEDVGVVSMQVKSRVMPIEMMSWAAPFSRSLKRQTVDSGDSESSNYLDGRKPFTLSGKRTHTGTIKLPGQPRDTEERKADVSRPVNLLQLAIHNDDSEMLSCMLDWAQNYTRIAAKLEQEDAKQAFSINHDDFLYAIQLDRPHTVAELIRRTGAGIPLNTLLKKSGAEAKEKPKYYQGLSVYGKKRKDWAARGRHDTSYKPIESLTPPLLKACHHQSIPCVEWFLSDSPIRCYTEFADANKGDKRLQRLAQVAGGLEATIKTFLASRAHLAIHSCIVSKPTISANRLLQYLIKSSPDTINVKSAQGLTPLQIAFELHRDGAAKLLIQAGADQTCRDTSGRNLLHNLLARPVTSEKQLSHLSVMLDLIDKRLLTSMVIERCSDPPGSLTPLAYWLNLVTSSDYKLDSYDSETLRIILEYSKGAELSVVNGEGDTPLHRTVKTAEPLLTKIILEHSPGLLNRENATGRTPFEMAEDATIAAMCRQPRDGQRTSSQTQCNLVDRSAESFLDERPNDPDKNADRIWDMLCELKSKRDAQGQGKRRLVTLYEANEVARRLALRKPARQPHRSQDGGDDEGEQETVAEASDEVQKWLPHAPIDV